MTPKKIMKMVQKWRIEALRSGSSKINEARTYKGHFVVYATDKIRFVMPLHYLNNIVFLELLRISEGEFGLPRDGPITLPCDSMLMNYLVNIFERGFSKDFEKTLLAFVIGDKCSCVH
ncbi:putative small auxin-up RNA [Helianthus annuus]|uniref:Small auxin-up RNA n=1 Tax=Helianthus annuus TaxID=4232 RepID=A0A251RPQ0_HELAN|nr:putative small auxin-up RNA [Helianthus annuus]KAJ0812443.1 putative small auxin-up RNA [Helianthus annuus]